MPSGANRLAGIGRPTCSSSPPLRRAAEIRRLLLAEYQQRERIDPAWGCQALAIDLGADRATLTLQDPGGDLLKQALSKRLGIEEGLRLAIGLAVALRGLHSKGLIHQWLRPDRILIDSLSGQAWFITCALVAPSSESTCDLPGAAHTTWSYLAPEQCGGAGTVDGRSDLYGLGVILYRLLTGKLPFPADSLQQPLHAQWARLPPAPADMRPQLPRVLSRLVMTMLAKAPGDRYQSAAAVEGDLRRCLAAWQDSGEIVDFELCVEDAGSRLRPVQAFHGRESELSALRSAHRRVAQGGGCELVLLRGRRCALPAIHRHRARCRVRIQGRGRGGVHLTGYCRTGRNALSFDGGAVCKHGLHCTHGHRHDSKWIRRRWTDGLRNSSRAHMSTAQDHKPR
ncbi:serine/threonine protein kinase [Roseateles agri]|uniref:serine/threonine protein kinase n=1 Tax=Roseateles agri TaxID=3098619 RepID=UPI003D679FC6